MTEEQAALRELMMRLTEMERRLAKAQDDARFAQQLAKAAPGDTGGGGGTTLLRIWLPTGIAAGTFGSPGTATDAIIAVRSGNGWTTTGGQTGQTVYNCDTTAITGAKAAWAVRRDDLSLELAWGDC